MDTFDKVQEKVVLLAEQIDAENYGNANKTMEQLDVLIRQFTHQELDALPDEQKQYLHRLAKWLNDEDDDLKQRSQQLIETIAPFNRAGALKNKKQY